MPNGHHRACSLPRRLFSFMLVTLALLAGMLAMPVRAATVLYVDPLGNDAGTCAAPLAGACKTITAAINKAASGNTILIAAGSYIEDSPVINKNVTLTGAGVAQTLVQVTNGLIVRQPSASITVSISDLTLQHTSSRSALENSAILHASNINIVDNAGFGLMNFSPGTATITNADMSRNENSGIFNTGTLTLINSLVSGNTSTTGPGGIYNAGTLTLQNSRIISNHSTLLLNIYSAGGIYSEGSLKLDTSTVGGSTAEGNVGNSAGGILAYTGTLEVNNSSVSGNRSTSDSLFYSGGGIVISYQVAATIRDSLISGNVTDGNGGGISNGGTLTLARTTISGNRAGDKGYIGPLVGVGGGLYLNSNSRMTIDSSTISGNSAMGGGGGIALFTALATSMSNSTISGNTLNGPYGFGTAIAIDANGSGSIDLLNVTIAANTSNSAAHIAALANDNGGIGSLGGYFNLRNTIIAGNAGDLCSGALASQGYNLFDKQPGCVFTPTAGDQVGIDPKLGPLQPNGGPTQTHALLAGSPALDTGDCASAPAADQRGVARPQGPGCDIGAHEAGPVVRLAFSTQPSDSALAGQPFTTQPVVMVQDSYGNLANYNGPISISLGSAGALIGTATVVKGVASFSGLAIGQPGTGYTLVANAPGLLAATSAPIKVSGAPAASEQEPDNTIDQATPLIFDAQTHSALQGMISSAKDADLFSFSVRPGAIATINLTNLPADYDLALLPDPRATLALSDSIDLGQIADISRRIPDTSRRIPDTGGQLPDIGMGTLSDSELIARSSNHGTMSESMEAFLPRGGSYFVLVYSPAGMFSASPYRLDVALQDGGLSQSVTKARPLGPLALASDPAVKTIYLYNSTRMVTRYPAEADAVAQLSQALLPGRPLMLASSGAALDLANPPVGAADAALLPALYNLWDAAPQQPLLANELAQQIFYLLDRAIKDSYPNTTDIVLIGGDKIIPFYRVPDETEFANERQYRATLGGALAPGSALDGTLFRGFVQTDNFYADRQPTPWRGRALFLPDLGIGRLVERPREIMSYLNGYIASNSYTIDARGTGAAMVTGYDFLKDQAGAISKQLGAYGLNIANSTLNNDSWGLNDFTTMWFGGQLPQLGASYSGVQTPFTLTSLNGHFSHAAAIPADEHSPPFLAARIYTPTAQIDAQAFFKRNGTPTLIYTIGCHSGLSASDEDITTPSLRADFPQAVLKQGGNWIGNTGYGYGDANVIGYSERLSLLFTRALGRDLSNQGVSVGAALAYAKRQYLKTSGGSSFSVYDEKILTEFTLYGLPFLRVVLPPHAAPEPDEPAPVSIPANIRATLAQPDSNGLFTRIITLTNSFSPLDASGLVSVTSTLEDSFGANRAMSSIQQTASGKPVLPLLSTDITLQANPNQLKPGGADGIPVARSVRLRAATTMPDQSGFTPRVTNTITDQLGVQVVDDPDINVLGTWLPILPYAVQRTSYQPSATTVITNDRLLVFPAQFKRSAGGAGVLRRFTQMIYEITYVDPRSAALNVRAAQTPPVFDTIQFSIARTPALRATQATGDFSVRLSAAVRAAEAGASINAVSAFYTTDGHSWHQQALVINPDTGHYEANFQSTGAAFSAQLEAIDDNGNLAVATNKGAQFTITQVYLPVVAR